MIIEEREEFNANIPQTLNPNVQLYVAHSTSLKLDGDVICLHVLEDPEKILHILSILKVIQNLSSHPIKKVRNEQELNSTYRKAPHNHQSYSEGICNLRTNPDESQNLSDPEIL